MGGKRTMKKVKINQKEVKCNSFCPQCGYGPLSGLTCISEGDTYYEPEPGNITICLKCKSILVFTDEILNLRKATEEEISNLKKSDSWKLIEAVQQHVYR